MKNIFVVLLFSCVQAFYSSSVFAQGPIIDSVKILPNVPTKKDTVKIAFHVHTGAPGILLYLNNQLNNNTIDIKGCYSIVSGSTVPEYYDDTIKIGALAVGTYQVNFTAYLSVGTSNCTYEDSVKTTVPFSVIPPVTILTPSDDFLSIYPNPAKDFLYVNIDKNSQVENITIQNMHGRTLLHINNMKNYPLDISSIPLGIYLVYINTNQGRFMHKFIKE